MTRFIKILPAVLVFSAGVAYAETPPAAQMQRCTSNAECTLVTQSCATNCPTLPINTAFQQSYIERRNELCGNDAEGLLHCNVSPPLQPTCINNRCTVGYAFQNTSDEKDLINGGVQPPTRP
jgi:hypothetical protein